MSNFKIVWLDSHSNWHVQSILSTIIPDLLTFSDANACIDYILTECSTPDTVFLIVSGSLGLNIWTIIDTLPQLYAVYVYCVNNSKHTQWAQLCHKIGAHRVFSQEDQLIAKLMTDQEEATRKVKIDLQSLKWIN